MQTLFAYRRSRDANFELAKEHIKEVFSPDLNSMEYQDKELLKAQQKEALSLFNEHFKDRDFSATSDEKITNTLTEAVEDLERSNQKDGRHFEKQMVADAEKIYERYLRILMLLEIFADLAEKDVKRNHKNFVKNLLIRLMAEDDHYQSVILRHNLSWANEFNEVRGWFKEFVREDEKYAKYQVLKEPTFKDDQDILQHIVKNFFFKNEIIDKYFEHHDLNWDEDRAIVKSLASKTIKAATSDSQGLELQELSYNWEDDKAFFLMLFEETIKVQDEYDEIIERHTENWDIERIASTDKIILEMAICEMIKFPSIPIKVTINEYIEVAKRYSTPKSKVFINGVLDVIAAELTTSGKIKKSGRGLIDNK